MSHMPSFGDDGESCGGGCSGGSRIVPYEATGDELETGFDVDIGTTLASADFSVSFFSAVGDINVPVVWVEHPEGYTTTKFRVGFGGGSLTPGGIYKFEIRE